MIINKKIGLWLALVVFGFSLIVGGCLCSLSTLKILEIKQEVDQIATERADYKKHTDPLESETVTDLCLRLDIQEGDPRCQPNAVVYGPEFFPEIRAYVKNLPDGLKTQPEVEKLLGPYRDFCSDPVKPMIGATTYRCIYLLKSDGTSGISVTYKEDGTIYNTIYFGSGGS